MARSMFALDQGAATKRPRADNVFDIADHREPSVEEVAILRRDRPGREAPHSSALAARPEDRPAPRVARHRTSWKLVALAALGGVALTAAALTFWEMGRSVPVTKPPTAALPAPENSASVAPMQPPTDGGANQVALPGIEPALAPMPPLEMGRSGPGTPPTTTSALPAPETSASVASMQPPTGGGANQIALPGIEPALAPMPPLRLAAVAAPDTPPTLDLLGPDATFAIALTAPDTAAPTPIEAATGMEQRLAPVLPRAFLRAPNPLSDERPQPTAALVTPRVVVHYAGLAEGRALEIARAAQATLGTVVETRRVDGGVRRTNIRYFHHADQTLARFVAGLSDSSDLRDYTGFEPKPRRGLIEVWLAP